MGFKKSKKPKKAKKTSRSKDRVWENEGGVHFEEKQPDPQPDGNEKRKRRETQDRDERLRRGRAKIEYKQQQQELKKKWSTKVKFTDFFRAEDEDDIAQESVRVCKTKAPYSKSSVSVFERFQKLLQRSHTSEENTENKKEGTMNAVSAISIDRTTPTVQAKQDKDALDLDDTEIVSDHDASELIDEGDDDIGDTETSIFEWFFSSTSAPSSEASLEKRVLSTGDKLYLKLCPDIRSFISQINSLKHVPALNKMWRSRGAEMVPKSAKSLLPFMCAYADILWEGRDHSNDEEIINSMVIHIATHVVKSRYVFSYKMKRNLINLFIF